MESFGAQDLSEARDTEVDGEEAFERDYSLSQQGQELRGRQVVVRRDRLYTITFTVSEDRFEDEVSEFEEILDSWRWD